MMTWGTPILGHLQLMYAKLVNITPPYSLDFAQLSLRKIHYRSHQSCHFIHGFWASISINSSGIGAMFTNLAKWTRIKNGHYLVCEATGNQLAVAENGGPEGNTSFTSNGLDQKKSRLPGHLLPLAATFCQLGCTTVSMFSKPADWVRPIFFVLNTYLHIYI